MSNSKKQLWIEILKVIISALAGALSAIGVTTSCTVYSGSNEVSTSPSVRKQYNVLDGKKTELSNDSLVFRLRELEKKMNEIY